MVTVAANIPVPIKPPRNVRNEPTGEYVVLCPGCKALQTITIVGNNILPTRKYTQTGDRIFHDCGSVDACRLFTIT